jgi:cobalt/nickel transport system permease protein
LRLIALVDQGERMHLHEAVLAGSPEGIAVLCVGAVGTAVGTGIGLRAMDHEKVPRVAIVTAVFFVVSLIHVPLGLTSVHLMLVGLVGLMLGWAAFPALLIALLLQAVLLGHGGLLALGVNTLAMGLPAVFSYYLFHRILACRNDSLALLAGWAAGAFGMFGAAFLMAGALWVSGKQFELAATAVLVSHLLIALVEGLVTGGAVMFLRKVHPSLLAMPAFALSPATSWDVETAGDHLA